MIRLVLYRHQRADEVFTMSEKVIQSRKQTLDLLLSDHNIHCFSCEGNGDCKLQDYAYEYGLVIPVMKVKRAVEKLMIPISFLLMTRAFVFYATDVSIPVMKS